MWFFIYAVVVVRLWIVSFFWSPLHLFVLFTLVYALFYGFRSSHQNGAWQWRWFRSWSLWDKVRARHFGHTWHQVCGWNEFQRRGEPYLFIVVSSSPQTGRFGVGTIVPFALYGKHNDTLRRLSPLITAPQFFFYIPLLCDILQWCGCIVDTADAREEALLHNVSLVWSPQIPPAVDVMDPLQLQPELSSLPTDTFEWISTIHQEKRLNLVPVYSVGEEGTYYDATPSLILPLQRWCRSHLGYFPRMLFGWLGSPFPRRCTLRTLVADPISTLGRSGVELAAEFASAIRTLAKSSSSAMTSIRITK